MLNVLDQVLELISLKDANHAKKLRKNLDYLDNEHQQEANHFLNKYLRVLEELEKDLSFTVDCYLHLIEDMKEERFNFNKTGKYSHSNFKEVEIKIYANPDVMDFYMHGLVIGQFLWFEQYERYIFFKKNLKKHIKSHQSYLEIGGGHGLYINAASEELSQTLRFDVVDVSESSLELAKSIINNDKINYHRKDIYDFTEEDKYDFITAGEVLEHVEDPAELLCKIKSHLSDNGVCFLSIPVNAPMMDHIYLFNHENEIRKLIKDGGFRIIEEKIELSEKVSLEMAREYKLPIMYAAFVEKIV